MRLFGAASTYLYVRVLTDKPSEQCPGVIWARVATLATSGDSLMPASSTKQNLTIA